MSPAPTGRTNGTIPGRIAYVTPDFEIFTVSGDGSNPVRVSPVQGGTTSATPDDIYVWPLWVPDGDRLLFSRIQPPDQFGSRVALVSAGADGLDPEPVVVYEDDPETAGVGASAPHYTAFSPDGKALAAIVGSRDGLVLTVFDMTRPGSRGTDLVRGAPLYFDWSRDSTTLVVHLGERLLTFDLESGGDPDAAGPIAPTSFLAPALSRISDRTAVVLDLPAGRELRLLGQDAGFLAAAPAGVLFAWSPEDGRLAVLAQTNAETPPGLFDELAVIDISSDGERTERVLQSNRSIRSAWWSPDGQQLALALVDEDDRRATRWEVVNIQSGKSVHVATLIPSAEFDFVQTFAGQYERSHNFWSPDSRYMVLTGSLRISGAGNADPFDTGQAEVWVVAADGITPARSLGPGAIGFWSPR